MRTATLLFTYNRSFHTSQVIESLKHNTVMPEKLIVFQDGLKQTESADEWEEVNRLINDIDWCEREIIVSGYNKGLAESIVSGIDYAFQNCDAVIVLEDDCVTAPGFIQFMRQCFIRYKNDKRVYSVSGYSWPIELPQVPGDSDIYFCGRTSSWGWGTWKDRWQGYEKDYTLYKRLKSTQEGSQNLAMWASDLEGALIGSVTGRADIWGLFWVLKVIREQGLCINPYKSLIRNIGMDGTGVNCGNVEGYEVDLDQDVKENYHMEDRMKIRDSVKKAFTGLFGSATALNVNGGGKERIVVYGLGGFFLKHEEEINQCYYIEAFIDNAKHGYYAGKTVVKLRDISTIRDYSKILVMVQDINECMKITKELAGMYGIGMEKIELGCQRYGLYRSFIEDICIRTDGTWEITFRGKEE